MKYSETDTGRKLVGMFAALVDKMAEDDQDTAFVRFPVERADGSSDEAIVLITTATPIADELQATLEEALGELGVDLEVKGPPGAAEG